MAPRRPPDILRKSHAHVEGRTRAKEKRELENAVEESIASDPAGKALLIDLDGVVYRGEEPIAGAADVIHRLVDDGVPHLFVTNTTSRPLSALVGKLARFGIAVREEEILSPPDAAAAWLAAHGCRRLMLLVPEATAAAFADFETLTGDEMPDTQAPVDAVVVGDLGRGWSFDRLNNAFRCLMQKPAPKLVALGMTRYWHAPDGLRLDTAPFVIALAHASGIEPTVLGKPARAFFDAALARLGVEAAQAAMIGDDIRADVGGAQAAGLAGILVKTGKFRPGDLDQGIAPDLVIDSIADLPFR
jgi:HAD superfamily hydrolase (TIGR01458 family)